jgi:hypothetical protein
MRYKILGVFLLLIFGFNLYAIIRDIVQEKSSGSLYYFGMVMASLVAGIYFLFLHKRKQ